MASVALNNVYKYFDKKTVAVKDLSIDIKDKELVVLVGPSGCGKSTTLRMIAGLEDISEGDLYIGDKRVNKVPPKDRDIAMVFQNYALYPHMTVFENMAFGLKLHKRPKVEIKQSVEKAADILGIKDLLSRKPKALSGDSGNGLPWVERLLEIRRYFFLMNRCRTWTPSSGCKCGPKYQNFIADLKPP